jgi:hypothetical protein
MYKYTETDGSNLNLVLVINVSLELLELSRFGAKKCRKIDLL